MSEQTDELEIILTCPVCDEMICEHTVDQIRGMENALIVAKQAIVSLEGFERKYAKEIRDLRKENRTLKEKLGNKRTQKILDQKFMIERNVARRNLAENIISGK